MLWWDAPSSSDERARRPSRGCCRLGRAAGTLASSGALVRRKFARCGGRRCLQRRKRVRRRHGAGCARRGAEQRTRMPDCNTQQSRATLQHLAAQLSKQLQSMQLAFDARHCAGRARGGRTGVKACVAWGAAWNRNNTLPHRHPANMQPLQPRKDAAIAVDTCMLRAMRAGMHGREGGRAAGGGAAPPAGPMRRSRLWPSLLCVTSSLSGPLTSDPCGRRAGSWRRAVEEET